MVVVVVVTASIYPFNYLSIYLSICLSTYLSTYPPIHLSTYLPIYLSTYLPIYLSTYLPTYQSIYLSICLSVCLSVCLSISLSLYLSISLPVYLSICLSASLKTKLFCETSSGFKLDNIKNAAIQRDFLNFWTWQRQKRSKSARLPLFFRLTTSKTKQFCETPSKMESWVQSWRPRANAFCIFSTSICLNYCTCHEKVMPGHTKCCTCHAKSSQQTWRSDAPKCNLSQEISARTS